MEGSMAGAGAWYVKVMTDEQMEQLRRQIAAYAIISEQLAEMHRATMARQDSLSGMRPSSLNSDPVMTSGGVKISARQRWAPTHMQVEILESIFQEGFRNPTKQRIKEITSDLSQHGQISESNVYNWFQNRRARRKRKKTTSEVEAESLNEKEVKTERTVADNCNLSPTVDHSFRSPDIISELLFFDPDPNGGHDTYALHDNWKFSGAYDEEMPAYGNSLSTPKKQH